MITIIVCLVMLLFPSVLLWLAKGCIEVIGIFVYGIRDRMKKMK